MVLQSRRLQASQLAIAIARSSAQKVALAPVCGSRHLVQQRDRNFVMLLSQFIGISVDYLWTTESQQQRRHC